MKRPPVSELPDLQKLFSWFLPLAGGLFLLAGGLTLWFLFLQPMRQTMQTSSWTETECKILESGIEQGKPRSSTLPGKAGDSRPRLTNSGANMTSFRPRITYEYLVEGQPQTCSRYSFFEVSSGQNWAAQITAKYKPGSRHRCYYNPSNPSDAVLSREFAGLGFWFGALFPLPFLLIGGLLLILGLRSARSKSRSSLSQG